MAYAAFGRSTEVFRFMANNNDPLFLKCEGPAEQLNRDCFCTTLNRQQLETILQADDHAQDVLATHPHLFSNTAVFISPTHLLQMQAIIQAITRVALMPAYAQLVLASAPDIAAYTPGTAGVFMGYDFHLGAQGPKIIEINTNAGGAFLNSALVSAQRECCGPTEGLLPHSKAQLDQLFLAMFTGEWQLQRGRQPLRTIAIIDAQPEQQYLFPEFNMAKRLFERHGINALIADPGELYIDENKVCIKQKGEKYSIDLIYNRLTDFTFAESCNSILREAYEKNWVVVTPNPHHHALYANKRNLCVFSDELLLKNLQVNPDDISVLLMAIPKTRTVTAANAEELWAARKQLFFKPSAGFGGRAAYRGDKLTRRVWGEILLND
jgi:hypothetical protein